MTSTHSLNFPPIPTANGGEVSLTEEQRLLLARARAGEEVRNDLLLTLQPALAGLAYKYAKLAEALGRASAYPSTEGDDLFQSAYLAMLTRYASCLSKRNPYSYLMQVARFTMISCIRDWMKQMRIRSCKVPEPAGLLSLDRPLSNGPILAEQLLVQPSRPPQPCKTQEKLLQGAVSALPEKQRAVIERHYGFETLPEPLNAISRSMTRQSTTPDPRNARYHHRRALAKLRSTFNQGSGFEEQSKEAT